MSTFLLLLVLMICDQIREFKSLKYAALRYNILIFIHLRVGLKRWQYFPTKILYAFIISPVRAFIPARSNRTGFTALVTLGEVR
jgi:hypothetical protein